MSVAALILLVVTVLAGTALLAEVAPALAANRRLLTVVSGHIALALAAVVLWTVVLIGDSGGLAWATFAAVAVAAALGTTALVRTLRGGETPEGLRISPAVIVVHGAAAAITVVLVLIAALVL